MEPAQVQGLTRKFWIRFWSGIEGIATTHEEKRLTHSKDFGSFNLPNLLIAMANTKSALKASRKALRNAARNQNIKTRLKTLAKGVQKAAAAGDAEKTRAAVITFTSALDKAVKGDVIHRNVASRHKSRLAKFVFAKK